MRRSRFAAADRRAEAQGGAGLAASAGRGAGGTGGAAIARRFPMDDIQPVPKGQFGGDLLHTVRDAAGQPCGTILWEFKRTQSWSAGWLAKLRGDQRAAGAELAVLASQTLPRDLTLFDQVEGVWVSSLACTLPVAVALRQALIELARVRRAGEGEQTKAQQVYTLPDRAAVPPSRGDDCGEVHRYARAIWTRSASSWSGSGPSAKSS